jgi:uncharacterized cupin superfamily protein
MVFVKSEQGRRLSECHDLRRVLAQGDASDGELVIVQMLPYRIAYELPLALTGCCRRCIETLGISVRQADVEGCEVASHALKISLDIASYHRTMNLFNPRWDGEVELSDGTRARAVQLARHAGASRLGATLYELDEGAAVSPLHFHHRNEELLFVISGAPTLRGANGAGRELAPGEVVSFLPGRGGTHQLVNHTDRPTRVLLCSTNDLPEIAEQVETGLLVLLTEDGGRLVSKDDGQILRQPG